MERKSLRELYTELKKKPKPKTISAATQFVTDVAALTQKSEITVRNWISGRQKPDYADKFLIAQKYKVDINSLFPTEEEAAN